MANISLHGEPLQLQPGQRYVLADARTLEGTTFAMGMSFGPGKIIPAVEGIDDPRFAFHTDSGWLVVARKDIWDDIQPLLRFDTLAADWKAIEARFDPGACGLIAIGGRGYHRLDIRIVTVTKSHTSHHYPIGHFFDKVPDAATLLQRIIDVVGLEPVAWDGLKEALRTKAMSLGEDSMALVLNGVDGLRREKQEVFRNLEIIAAELCAELGRDKVKISYPTVIKREGPSQVEEA
ncbi:MAG TPA: hypothetical protein VL547_23595 [Dinghuibacter sp.]|uniref:hypothetical protein n=1 Tax=Dinghuibacter sp. TaxID=2024697 RepID=UPI002C237883|nr:hypothetical protein [Dinghuibacter sp.]HTJ15050.1 hypothetical protein [Dinghuibacter sp.]